ncbi:reverse transcriptase [Phytophthora megakarya]|uniref:Reverse transcriptase n=1 Tax=Phytophthora megakarya TaxID=4795 RepID=A0A225W519_9STRA|nr:reverse transcriptase [Phytophthora megakarya]
MKKMQRNEKKPTLGFIPELSRATVPNRDTPMSPDAGDGDPLTVQRERRRRIATVLDEELRWANLKTVLRGDGSTLMYRAARDAWKMYDRFVLSEDNVIYYVGTRPLRRNQQQEETMLRLVVPSTLIQKVLQNCHDSLEGGHQGIARTFYRVELDYYWIGLYADVARHVRSCPDCSSSKSQPKIRGYSPGNILAERPFQRSYYSNAHSRGYVMGKAMADTTALRVAQTFGECVYRRFGEPSLIRHDRDPRFMSEVFQSLQANGQNERSVKTAIQSVRVYAEGQLQQDWDEIAEKLIVAINNSMDATRKETPFFLVHGWNAQFTLKVMPSFEDSVDSQTHWCGVEK